MAEYIERSKELILAVNAGARAIENTKRYHGAIYNMNVFSDNPQEIPYLKAAEILRGFDEIPSADVEPVRVELRKAVRLLNKEYEKAQRQPFVRDPLAYALYQVWKAADGGGCNG